MTIATTAIQDPETTDGPPDDAERVARGLGWFIIGLGLARITAPRRVARMIGVNDDEANRDTILAIGAIAAVVGITMVGVLASQNLAREPGTRPAVRRPRGIRVRKAVTIDRPRDEVYRFWRNFENLPRFMQHLEVVETGPGVKNLKTGDRVVVPFSIACGECFMCRRDLFSCCENSNPNAAMAEKLWGHSPAGAFGYSHLLGGFAGGQAQYARVPFADVGPLKVPDGMPDEQALFLSDIFPTGYMGADMCGIQPGDVIAVWGAGPVGLFAMASAYLLGAERVIAIDRFPYRLALARERLNVSDTINYEEENVLERLKELTGGRGPDACIDAVGMEAHGHAAMYAYDRAKQALMLETDRLIALREAIRACRNGGTVSVIGVYGGFIDRFPMGSS